MIMMNILMNLNNQENQCLHGIAGAGVGAGAGAGALA